MTDQLVDDLVQCLELLLIAPTEHLVEMAQAAAVAASRTSYRSDQVEHLKRASRLLAACLMVRDRMLPGAPTDQGGRRSAR
jgi:hypothetical protein